MMKEIVTDKHVLFWGGWLSNFASSPFELEGHKFFCVEQYFMWKKAVTFGDQEVANKILTCTNPRDAKNLGRQVRNYDDSVWSKIRFEVMKAGNKAKYGITMFRDMLLDPDFDGKGFVEASPYDKIWGIGISMEKPEADDESQWLGQNLLGKVLDEVRKEIKEGI